MLIGLSGRYFSKTLPDNNKKIPEAEASRILHKYVVLIIQQILLLLQLRELQLLLLQETCLKDDAAALDLAVNLLRILCQTDASHLSSTLDHHR